MKYHSVLFVVLSAACSIASQTLFKLGIGEHDFGVNMRTLRYFLTKPALLLGATAYVIASYTWLKALLSAELSVVFPLMVGVGFVLTFIVASTLFDEQISSLKIVGACSILAGIIMIVKA